MSSGLHPNGKYTAIWQAERFYETEWLMRIFAPHISNHVVDGKHEIVMDNAIVFDSFVYSRDPAYYEKFRGKNSFLVHLSDEFFELGYDRYLPFRGVFRTMWSDVFNPKYVMQIPLGFSVNMVASDVKASERRYAWSFVGDAEKTSRPDALRALSSIEPHVCFSSTEVPGITFFRATTKGKKKIPREDFVRYLGQSAFAPAPMGNGSLESCRIYDALECGAIPIIERRMTLDYFKRLLGDHPLPTVSSWSEARRLMEQISRDPKRLDELQQQCLEWWKSHQSTVTEKIGSFLEERSQATDAVVPLQSRLPLLPCWNYFELIRHHNLSALNRRLVRQFNRVMKDRKWRIAHRPGNNAKGWID
jgi:hypothetical protein